jgi:hypothetical protein
MEQPRVLDLVSRVSDGPATARAAASRPCAAHSTVKGAFHLSEQGQQEGEANPMPSSAVLSSGTERSRCGGSIQVVVSGYGVTMRARCPDKDHTDLPGAGRE